MMFWGYFSFFQVIVGVLIIVYTIRAITGHSKKNYHKSNTHTQRDIFAENCTKVEDLILVEKIYSIDEISNLLDLTRNETFKIIKFAINGGALKGFTINYPQLRVEKSLITNLKNAFNSKITSDTIIEVKCSYCGSHQNSNNSRCDCCGAPLRK